MYFSDIVIILLFFLMLRRPPISTRTDTLFPDTTLFRSGTLDLPHAQTHTVVLPHALAYNARAVPDAMRVLRIALGHDDPPTALYELARDNGAPVALRDLGMHEEDIEHVGDLALQDRYPNPRELDRDALLALLRDAYHGHPPSA